MKKILALVLFILAFSERVFYDLGPNIELVTLAMLVSAAYLGIKHSFYLTLILMFLTDLILGNTNIFIFTWSGFLIPAIVASNIFSKYRTKGIKRVAQGTITGAGANFFFFIWTNFGVWLLDPWGMYEKTTQGFLNSYIMAIPFWKNQLISTLIFVTIGFTITETAIYLAKRYNASRLAASKLV